MQENKKGQNKNVAEVRKHAKAIITMLHRRPVAKDESGEYCWILDEQQMIDIVESYLSKTLRIKT